MTRIFPLSSQVTLLVDKDAAIPVLNTRTLARSAAFGGAGGDAMELRYMAANADVRVGDELATSGVDGVYPAACRWRGWRRWSAAPSPASRASC